jgi:aminoglycoside N3'-acetyltransferase
LKPKNISKQNFLKIIIDTLLEFAGTLVIPTFTYTTSGVYDCKVTPTNLGSLNSTFVNNTQSIRSDHPIFSFTAIGDQSSIVEKIDKVAFGKDSLHSRLLNRNAAFLYIGKPVKSGNTLIHFVEKTVGVKYRFEKSFETQVFCGGKYLGSDYSAYVRKIDNPTNNYYFNFSKAHQKLKEEKCIFETNCNVDYSNISILPYDRTYQVLLDMLSKDENSFITESA